MIHALRKIGVTGDDKLFVHSDLKSFGKINPEISRNEYIDAFIIALMEVVGLKGTIIVPTFSYSFCNKRSMTLSRRVPRLVF